MHRISATIVALIMSSGLVFAAGTSGPMSVGDIDGAKIWLVVDKKPPKVKVIPPGAHQVTKGQKGKCICSQSGNPPHTVCTGAC
jgi:hypothetical protein